MINIYEYLLNKNTKSKQTIEATDETIKDIVDHEIEQLGFEADLNHIDVSKVTDFRNVFRLKKFNGDISEWDVSNAKMMDQMFQGCLGFNCDLGNWDVSNVVSMTKMFLLDTKFEGIGLENWKLNPRIEFLDMMFAGCEKFNRDISGWKVTTYVRMISKMFMNCTSFEQDLSSWEISSLSQHDAMFKGTPMAKKHKLQPKII